MGTIVQEYGPFYGEVANGSVQGRPNGSIYVPPVNTLQLTINSGYIVLNGTAYQPALSDGTVVSSDLKVGASSQDPSNMITFGLYTDAACTQEIAGFYHEWLAAGLFNTVKSRIGYGGTALTQGTSYYVRAELYTNSYQRVAVSNVVELVAA